MMMTKFVLVLSVVVAYIATEKFGNAQTVIIQRKIKNQLPITEFPVVRSFFVSIGINLQYQFLVRT